MDFKVLAKQLVELVGGEENIESVTHCITRLRFVFNALVKTIMGIVVPTAFLLFNLSTLKLNLSVSII